MVNHSMLTCISRCQNLCFCKWSSSIQDITQRFILVCIGGFNISVPALQDGIHKLITSMMTIRRIVASPIASPYVSC